jgi:DNA polymerase I-like protein with 3'-5' exonuclease and polymerase domains
MPTFAIDFETFYDRSYSLKKMDAWSYVHHPKFDAYLMSVYGVIPSSVAEGGDLGSSIDNHQSEIGNVFSWVGHPKDFQCWEKLEGALLLAHNAAFDSLVFHRLQEQKIIPPIQPAAWRCTASLAVYLSAPRSLKGACKQLLNIDVDKTQRSKASGQSGADLFGNEAMFAYALEDARLCYLLWEKFNHLWPDDEKELASLTFEWGQAGIGVDFQTLEKCIQTLEKQRFDAVQHLPWVDDFTEDAPLSHRQLALECRKANIPTPASLAMDSPLCEAWENKYGEEYPWVNAMRIFRRTNMLLSRFYAIRSRVRKEDNRFPYGMKYFGAVPGRWSGDAGFNVQNMPRGELFGVDLRKCFQPSDGNVFIIADLCQIEPRILAWIIEDEAFLSLVRSGVDIYEAHARSTMGYTDPAPLKEVDPKMRSLAKARVLGLGYGCGPKKFVSVAKNLGGIEISFAEAKQTVADFRSKNPRISRLWNQLDRDFKRSAGGDYSIELPSGRTLNYFDVKKTSRGYYTAKTVRGGRERSLYGGLLCENLVQASARDLFAWHLLKIHRALVGTIIFHVHDEVIVEVPREYADEARQYIEHLMSMTPEWLSGCPVAAEAGIFNYYTK